MSARPIVAVVDIGSNSIKVLVAARGPDGRVVPIFARSLDVRISAGLGGREPRLAAEGMARGEAAVLELLALARPHRPAAMAVVATSAVRDAANGPAFRARLEATTGLAVRILSGDEEARAIGRGLREDPDLGSLDDFLVFDLGGGSLECLAFRGGRIDQAVSLPLGCVRLTERFVADSSLPLAATLRATIATHVQAAVARGGFRFDLPGAVAIATGGTASTLRMVLGAGLGPKMADSPSQLTVHDLRSTLDRIAALPLATRRMVAGLPAARADVFPVALITLLAIAEAGGIGAFRHSHHNLRFGIAAELLDAT